MNAPTPSLGRLERVPLRRAWATEAQDFTPWLGLPENLRLLGETVGMVLELEAQEQESVGCPAHLKELRSALVGNGVLKAAGDQLFFTQDYQFASPSTAAGVVFGRSTNGRKEWKTKAGQTLKELQELTE